MFPPIFSEKNFPEFAGANSGNRIGFLACISNTFHFLLNMNFSHLSRFPYLGVKTMGKRPKITQEDIHKFQKQKEMITGQIGRKLEEQLAAKNVNANMLGKATNMKPETLYKIRDGLQLPSCETIIKVKQMLPDLNLNWWLFDQGEPDLQSVEKLKEENQNLRKEIQKYQGITSEIKSLLDSTS